MVTFDICKGNPGALTFVMLAYEYNPYRAEAAFRRMQNNGITGDKLYMLSVAAVIPDHIQRHHRGQVVYALE